MPDCRMTGIGMDLEGYGNGLMEVLPKHLPRSSEGNHKAFVQDIRSTDRNVNRAFPEYKFRAL
jgi:hypothetical protein